MALIVWFSNKLIFNEIVFFIYVLRIYDIPDRTTISIVPTFTTNTYTGLKHAMEVSKSSIIRENVSITNNIIWNKTLQKVWGEWNLHRRKLRYFLLTGFCPGGGGCIFVQGRWQPSRSDLQRGLDRCLLHTQIWTQDRTRSPLKYQRTTNATLTLMVKDE